MNVHLPPEIVALVLEAFSADNPPKRQLSAASLVCKHWCTRIRPHIFVRLTLRCEADARQLLRFFHRPTCHIPDFVSSLTLEDRHPDTSWIRNGALILPKQLPRLARLHVRTMNCTAAGEAKQQDQYARLPGTLPASMSGFKTVRTFQLCGYTFKSFQAFAHLVGALPLLEKLNCEQVVWDRPFEGWSLPRRAGVCSRLSRVRARRCTAYWPFVWLFWTSSIARWKTSQFLSIGFEDASSLASLIRLLDPSDGTMSSDYWDFQRKPSERNQTPTYGYVLRLMRIHSERLKVRVEGSFTKNIAVELRACHQTTTGAPVTTAAVHVIHLHTSSPLKTLQTLNWDAIDVVLSQLLQLRKLHLYCGAELYRDEFHHFAYDLAWHMPLMCRARLLSMERRPDGPRGFHPRDVRENAWMALTPIPHVDPPSDGAAKRRAIACTRDDGERGVNLGKAFAMQPTGLDNPEAMFFAGAQSTIVYCISVSPSQVLRYYPLCIVL